MKEAQIEELLALGSKKFPGEQLPQLKLGPSYFR